MKIITWNCNMAFRKKFEKIVDLQPDLLLLQECEQEPKLKEALKNTAAKQIIWYGKNPHKGTAAISFNDIEIEAAEDHNPEFEFIVPLQLKIQKRKINLFNIWAMPHQIDRKKDYVGQIYGAIQYYADKLKDESILIGDFNSNAIWDKKKKIGNHSDVVANLKEQNIESLYHLINKIKHGEEPNPTLYLLKNKGKPYHMDYCFASQSLISAETTISVGKYIDWIKWSDHMPVIIDHLSLH